MDRLADLLEQACGPKPLPPDDAEALALVGRSYPVTAGASPFDEQAPSDALWLVASGCVTLGDVDGEGRRKPCRSFHRGQWLDVASAWLGLPVAERCVAEADSTLYAFPIAEVEALCRRRPTIARMLLSLLARHVRESTQNTRHLLTRDALSRCAGWLLGALRGSGDGATVVLDQRKSTVAWELGTSPETFSRTLRRLREMGAIDVKGARIFVRDATALHRLATP
jgi:CRP/FNR family transcriptional regulator